MGFVGWIDHIDYDGPIRDLSLLEEPKFLLSAIIISPSEEGFQHAVRGWARFSSIAEAIYAYVLQAKKGSLDRRELLFKLMELMPKMAIGDILALQRVLKLGLGITTCDLGLVALSYTPLGPRPAPPLGTIFELRGEDGVVYIARNGKGPAVYDGDTMCVSPMSSVPPLHPLYEAYLRGHRIVTEGTPSGDDLCVVRRKLPLSCVNLGQLPPLRQGD